MLNPNKIYKFDYQEANKKYARAKELQQSKKYSEAFRAFENVIQEYKNFPFSNKIGGKIKDCKHRLVAIVRKL